MKIFFDLTSADVYMSKTGTGAYTLTAQLQGLWHDFKATTNDARLFDAFGDDEPDSIDMVTDAVRNLITDTLLDSQVDVGQMKGFFIGDSLWLPIPNGKQGYFRWGNDEYWLTPYHYEVYTSEGDGTMTIESFDTLAEAEDYAATNPLYKVDRWADIALPMRF